MHKLHVIGDLPFTVKELGMLAARHGFSLRRFRTISDALARTGEATVIMIDGGQSADPGFGQFVRDTHTIPKVVILDRLASRGRSQWLRTALTHVAVNPGLEELSLHMTRALADGQFLRDHAHITERCSSMERQLELLEGLSRTLTSSLDLNSIIDTIMKHIAELTGAGGWSIYLLREDPQRLVLEKSHRPRASKGQPRPSIGLGEGIADRVAAKGEPVIFPASRRKARTSAEPVRPLRAGMRSVLCAPLKSKGAVLGVIEIYKERGRPFDTDDLQRVLKLVDHASLAIERASLYQKMAEQAITDDLTKLFNSRYLNRTIETEISRCERYSSSVSLIFMDIDYFKTVNDRHGHVAGSKVLVEMGQILIKGLRTIDIVARYGGDEFVIVLPQTSPVIAASIAERLRKTINKHVFLKAEQLNLKLTASFGVASYPESARSKDELLRLADEAMYTVKNRTRDGVYSIVVPR